MSGNKTVQRPSAPGFGLNEAAYIRESALRGFLEPVIIARIDYSTKTRGYVYRYLKNQRLSGLIFQEGRAVSVRSALNKELAPIAVNESELVRLCVALDLQLTFLQARLKEAEDELEHVCGSDGDEVPDEVVASTMLDFTVNPQAPRFGINEVVYLSESAETLGRLERMRVDAVEFDSATQKWVYTFHFVQKPGENATVGDRRDLRSPVVVRRFENELLKACEAIPLRVAFLQSAINTAQVNTDRFCDDTPIVVV